MCADILGAYRALFDLKAGGVVVRPRSAGWDRIVPGGRFIDRFDRAPDTIGGKLASDCRGGDNVKPRDVRNGMEEKDWSYWGGNITKVGREYRLFFALARRR